MTTSANDISFVLSGGSVNIDPNRSIGGDPSATPITTAVLNNLFDDILPEESDDGVEDYRCFYIFNDGDTTIYSIKLWIHDDFVDGSSMSMGFEQRNESQRLTITGAVTNGYLTLSYKGTEFTTNYNANLGTWASQLQTTLRNLTDNENVKYFEELSVIAQNAASNTIIFDIFFSGLDAKRNIDKFQEVSNDLEPIGLVNITLSVTQEGAPVNTIAAEINEETTPPGGITFVVPTLANPLQIPRLKPSEGFPVWIKRTTVSNTGPKERDGFILKFRSSSKKP